MTISKLLLPLKNKLNALKSKMKGTYGLVALTCCTSVLLGSIAAIKAPELHNQWLMSTVGSKVYMIKGKKDGGGGTGFSLKAPSGQTYIITNSHVCEGALEQSEDKQALLVMDDYGMSMRRKIIEISDKSDLCIMEGMPGVEGLSLSARPNIGDTSYIVGHPRLRPLSVAAGETVGAMDVPILSYIMKGNPAIDEMMPTSDKKCDLPKNRMETVDTMLFGSVTICLNVTTAAYITTITIHPGNSGSPMVDAWGNVQGVAFAHDGTNWALVVSLKDLREFTANY